MADKVCKKPFFRYPRKTAREGVNPPPPAGLKDVVQDGNAYMKYNFWLAWEGSLHCNYGSQRTPKRVNYGGRLSVLGGVEPHVAKFTQKINQFTALGEIGPWYGSLRNASLTASSFRAK